MMQRILIIALALIIIALGIAVIIAHNRIDNLRSEQAGINKKQFEQTLAVLDSTVKANKDSLKIVHETITKVKYETAQQIEHVGNTRDIDSLIALYHRHRASPGTRYRTR